eukprot:15302692-Ditylum_brightwellii.AAC.1
MNLMHDVGGYVNRLHPLAFAAKANAFDTPNYYQAINRPDVPLFMDATKEELDMLEALEAWELIGIDKVPLLPNGSPQNIIKSTWAFKVKRFPDRGSRKEKQDYADVVTNRSKMWTTLKPMHLLSLGQPSIL